MKTGKNISGKNASILPLPADFEATTEEKLLFSHYETC